jgi:hypothetical protein
LPISSALGRTRDARSTEGDDASAATPFLAAEMTIRLYGFWRSLATFRVRAALNFKGLDYVEQTVDLTRGEQFEAGFHRLNPQHVLPVLEPEVDPSLVR